MSQEKTQEKGLNVSTKSFIVAIAFIFALMIVTYILTFIVPGGTYERIDGKVVGGTYTAVEGGIPFWKWILSPVLLLGSDDGLNAILIIVFLFVIGGSFEALNRCGLMKYMLAKITNKFSKSKYKLLAVIIFFFMAMGSLIGSFEECVPLVPIVVALAISLGWDTLTGIGMSLLSVGCGFAAGVLNPFTVGLAQSQPSVNLPMFSGIWLRAVAFVLIYALLFVFVYSHAKKVERKTDYAETAFEKDAKKDKALIIFATVLSVGIVIVLSSALITFLRDYTLPIVALMFLVAGVWSSLASGMKLGEFFKTFGRGIVSMLPAVLMILMASSIKYTLTEAKVLDTILYKATTLAEKLPSWCVILFIYAIVLVMNFFVASGSAKVFMLIPLIVPIAEAFGISSQLCIVAFAFGDGFSNVFYPTNPVLLISLGLVDVSYGKWAKWSGKFQIANLVLTCALLMLGLAVGY